MSEREPRTRDEVTAKLSFRAAAMALFLGIVSATGAPSSLNPGEQVVTEEYNEAYTRYRALLGRIRAHQDAIAAGETVKDPVIEELFAILMRHINDAALEKNELLQSSQKMSAYEEEERRRLVAMLFKGDGARERWDTIVRYAQSHADVLVARGSTHVDRFLLEVKHKLFGTVAVEAFEERVAEDPEFLRAFLTRLEYGFLGFQGKHLERNGHALDAMSALDFEIMRIYFSFLPAADAQRMLRDITEELEQGRLCAPEGNTASGEVEKLISAVCATAQHVDSHPFWNGNMPLADMGHNGLDVLQDNESRKAIEALLAYMWRERAYFESDELLKKRVFEPFDVRVREGKKAWDLDEVITNMRLTQLPGAGILSSAFEDVPARVRENAGIVSRIAVLLAEKVRMGDAHAQELLPIVLHLVQRIDTIDERTKSKK